MRYVIMANGQGRRWKNHLGIPKHLAPTPTGETLVERTARLVVELDPEAEVVMSAHDERYAVAGTRLYTPCAAQFEIDRFVPELLDRRCCFLYGDTYYTEDVMRLICATPAKEGLLAFGNEQRIFALRVEEHRRVLAVLRDLRARIASGEIPDCKGWQLYHAFWGMPLEGKNIDRGFVLVNDETTDFNTAEEYRVFMEKAGEQCEASHAAH